MPTVMARIVEVFTRGRRRCLVRLARRRASSAHDYDPDDYEQIFDIVDVWFESGSTHAFVLEARGLPWPADLYLEGSDQHRGWFQSSLLESVGTRGVAPFKAIADRTASCSTSRAARCPSRSATSPPRRR